MIGPARSGTGIHIDPLGTSAWNTLISGHKRWVMLPTTTPKHLLHVEKGSGQNQAGEGIQWFTKVYPKIKSPSWPQEYKPVSKYVLVNFGLEVALSLCQICLPHGFVCYGFVP